MKHKKYFIQGLPHGYEISHELKNIEKPRALPPSVIHYAEKHVINFALFNYKSHLYSNIMN